MAVKIMGAEGNGSQIGIIALLLLGYKYHQLFSFSILTSALGLMQTWDFGNAIAALVAVGGYLTEHLFSRKRAQLDKHMERVEAQSHRLLVPVTLQFHRVWAGGIVNFVDRHCEDALLANKGEYKDTLELCTNKLKRWGDAPKDFPFEAATSYRNAVSGPWALEVLHHDDGGDGPGVWRVTHPRELPLILHNEIVNCDRPNSKLWESYEAFIRHRFVPGMERIGEIIDEHGHLMEPVTGARLKEIFKTEGNGYGIKWTIAPRMWFYSYTLAYVDSWKELLSKWDAGNYDEIRPSVDFPTGLLRFNIEMQEIVAKVEQSLIGTSQFYGHTNQHFQGPRIG